MMTSFSTTSMRSFRCRYSNLAVFNLVSSEVSALTAPHLYNVLFTVFRSSRSRSSTTVWRAPSARRGRTRERERERDGRRVRQSVSRRRRSTDWQTANARRWSSGRERTDYRSSSSWHPLYTFWLRSELIYMFLSAPASCFQYIKELTNNWFEPYQFSVVG